MSLDAALPWHAGVSREIDGVARLGVGIIVTFVGAFFIWGVLATLDSAVIARGSFVASGKNRIIQHLEGGIVRAVMVREGERVKRGQVLMQVDDTAARSELSRLTLRKNRLLAMVARLDAERLNWFEPQFPASLVRSADPEVRAVLDGQRNEFLAKKERYASEVDVIDQQIKALQEQREGLQAQLASTRMQVDLIGRQIAPLEALYRQGYARLPQILELKRQRSQLLGMVGAYAAQSAQVQQKILELNSQILALQAKRTEAAESELQQVQNELTDIEQRIHSRQDVVVRSDLRAPADGTVVKMAQHKPGGVIAAGAEVIEILPVGEELLIEAYVRPDEIEAVKLGNRAALKLLAVKAKSGHMVAGEVIYVSADAIQSADKTSSFYVIRVRPAEGERAFLLEHRAGAGMPVEVFVATGERSFFDWMTSPIRDSFNRAFRER